MSKKVCSLGVWDESVPDIEFDHSGVSNYARLFLTLVDAYPRGKVGKSEWERIVNQIKKHGKNKRYDCIIGVSGGTDSSYLLLVAREYGLRPLAVNLDNGWNSDISVKNIKSMTDQLNIDLETYVIDYEEIKDLLRSYILAGLPWIDIPTDLAIKAVLYKIAAREGVKFVLRGNDFRSEGSQPEEWTYGDGRQLKFVHKRFGRVKLKTFPNYTITSLLYYGFFRQIKSIYPFYYLDYSKTQAQEILIKNYNWQYYGGHHYENHFTKFAISYWLFEKFGIDKRKITLSAQIMSNEITRDKAIDELKKKPYDDNEIELTLGFVLKKLDLSKDEFQNAFISPNRSFHDFPSYNYILTRLMIVAKPILSLVFMHRPQSLFQTEMRQKKGK